MQTSLPERLLAQEQGQEADAILRSCVQCGFCTATCPTYQLRGDELDGPRGRIWLIKEMLEREQAGPETREHLDRCLSCRACETTCPSGVRYGRLLEIGREHLETRVSRPLPDRLQRWLLRMIVPYRRRFGALLRVGQALRPAMPRALAARVPPRQPRARAVMPEVGSHSRKVIVLRGCVQSSATPATAAATRRVLDALGIGVLAPDASGCCGALPLHLSAREQAQALARRNIDAWWPLLEQGAEAVLVEASGCGLQVKEYDQLLADDPAYAERAAQVAAAARDLSEYLPELPQLQGPELQTWRLPRPLRVAWQAPCTLQHGQGLADGVASLLRGLGAELVPVTDPHLCCGSAGTYSLLQPGFASDLRARKLDSLGVSAPTGRPDVIATANIGCQLHLAGGTDIPVRHWIELVADALDDPTHSQG